MSIPSDFIRKRITQTDIRGGGKKSKAGDNYLDTNVSKLRIPAALIPHVKTLIREQVRRFLSKILDEDEVEEVLEKTCLSRIFKKLGI